MCTVAPDGRSLSLSAKLPDGTLVYEVSLSEQAVRTTLRARVLPGAAIGPVEYAAFMLPPDAVAGGTLRSFGQDGSPARAAVIAEPKRGAMAPTSESFSVETEKRTLTASSLSAAGVYTFDARVPQYGSSMGLWGFSSPR